MHERPYVSKQITLPLKLFDQTTVRRERETESLLFVIGDVESSRRVTESNEINRSNRPSAS